MTRPFEHPVRYGARLGVRDGSRPVAEILAVCASPCTWQRVIDNGHGRDAFERLTLEHSGFRRCQATDCPAWLVDAMTEKRKQTVVDAEQNPAGNQALRLEQIGNGRAEFRVRYLKDGDELDEGEVRVMTHFATCTNPEQFRKAKP